MRNPFRGFSKATAPAVPSAASGWEILQAAELILIAPNSYKARRL